MNLSPLSCLYLARAEASLVHTETDGYMQPIASLPLCMHGYIHRTATDSCCTTALTIQLPVSADLAGERVGRSGEEEVHLHCAPINSGTTIDESNTQRWEIREYWRM